MQNRTNTNMAAAEISGLWSTYISDSLGISMMNYFISRLEDEEIGSILEKAINISKGHIQVVKDKFIQRGMPIPKGFSGEDVNPNAPRLFTDSFYLVYLLSMAHYGMNEYTLSLNNVVRTDMRDFFSNCIKECIDLFNLAADALQKRGFSIKSPRVEFRKEVDFIDNQNFFSTGWFRKKRSLMAREINVLSTSLRQNIIGSAMITGFAQVAQSKEVQDFFMRGRDISWNKVEKLNSFFIDEKIPVLSTADSFVTDSTVPTFSDKLMLNMILMMFAMGLQQDGVGLANVMRHDLQAYYTSSSAETTRYAEDCLDILIKNKWLEQPPVVVEAKELVKS